MRKVTLIVISIILLTILTSISYAQIPMSVTRLNMALEQAETINDRIRNNAYAISHGDSELFSDTIDIVNTNQELISTLKKANTQYANTYDPITKHDLEKIIIDGMQLLALGLSTPVLMNYDDFGLTEPEARNLLNSLENVIK